MFAGLDLDGVVVVSLSALAIEPISSDDFDLSDESTTEVIVMANLSRPSLLSVCSAARAPACALKLAVLAIAAWAGVAFAQPAPAEFGPFVLERVTRDRWVHEGQHPGFVAFQLDDGAIHLRGSVSRTADGWRHLTLRLSNLQAILLLDLTNRLRSATVDQPPITYDEPGYGRFYADRHVRRLRGPGALLSLPAMRFREVPFVMPRAPLAPGLVWHDTLSFQVDGEGLEESLYSVWRHEVIGDTTIEGRPLPLVRSEAELRYRSRELTADHALDVMFEITRDVSGTLAGHAAVDTTMGVRVWAVDSTSLAGEAVLHTGAGLVSQVRYERNRKWLLRDSTEWSRMRDSLMAERRAQDTGMLILPRTPLEERIRAGDVAAVDSLYEAWRNTTDPNERTAIGALLRWADARGSSGANVGDQLRALRLEAGDSAGVLAEAVQSIGRSSLPWDELLPYLDEPERLWRLGIVPGYAYAELADAMLRASPIVEPDSTRWPCEPALCRTIVSLIDTAREPRLRDVALAGAFVRDPARWWDRVLARADSGSLIAANAVRLGRGVGATWPAAPQTPVPEPGADWRVWLDWLGGADRWGESHAHALRVYAARTGRDPLDEVRTAWPPEGDSARLVIATILRGMNVLAEPTASELADLLLSGSEANVRRAQRDLVTRVRRDGRPASDSLRAALLRPLIDSIATRGDAPWPGVRDGVDRPRGRWIHRWAITFHGVDDVPVFVLDEELPRAVASALPSDFTLITPGAWDARPLRDGAALITLRPIVEWEGFVELGWSWRVFERRAPEQAPSGFAGGGSVILLRTSNGWVVVNHTAWIT